MTDNRFEFFDCDNPECRLRFPGYDGYPKSKRCPVCRSGLHVAVPVINSKEVEAPVSIDIKWKVEAIIDNVRSAWNVGSIFRTADGTGVQKLYLTGITPTPDNKKVSKTALGAESIIPWEKYNNGVELARLVKSKGYILWALEDLPNAIPLFQVDFPKDNSSIIFIVGNEVSGVDPGILELCDRTISIPMLGKKQSYNVAVAFGITASFLLYRQSVSQGSRNILPNT